MTDVHPVQQVRAALYGALKAGVSGRRDLTVRYGIPGEEVGARFVCIANGRHKAKPAAMGRSVPIGVGGMTYARDLKVEVDVVIQVKSSKDPIDVDAEAWNLARQVEVAIASDHSLAGTAWNCQVTEGDQTQSYETTKNIATVVLLVSADVRA